MILNAHTEYMAICAYLCEDCVDNNYINKHYANIETRDKEYKGGWLK